MDKQYVIPEAEEIKISFENNFMETMVGPNPNPGGPEE